MGQGLEVEPDDLHAAAAYYVLQSSELERYSSTFASGARLTAGDFGDTAETAKAAEQYNTVYTDVLEQLKVAGTGLSDFAMLLSGAAAKYEKMDRANTVKVKTGDTLSGIAKRKLGDPNRYPEIAKNNPKIKDPDLIYPGQKIEVRPKEDLKLPWPKKR